MYADKKTCRKRMATLAVVYDADPAPCRSHYMGGLFTKRLAAVEYGQ
ncbi:hypothetical protein OHT93_37375 [Streptomyces sp. NBC_00191]